MLKRSVVLVIAVVLMLDPNVTTESAANTRGGPAPAVDCSSLVLNMADCLSYVTNGSTEQMPEGTCCSGLKSVLKTDVQCVCEAFKNSAQLGVTLNITKALSLPTACHVSAPSVTTCGIVSVGSGGAAPALSPLAVSPSSTAAAASPTDNGGLGNEVSAPAPTPIPGSGTSSSSTVAFVASSLLMVVVGIHLLLV